MTSRRRLVACTLIAVAVHGAVARAMFVIPGIRERVYVHHLLFDEKVYFAYATQWAGGKVPYRDFRVEYPPLAFPLFALPLLATQEFASYLGAFGAEMLLFDAALVYLLARRAAEAGGMGRAVGRVAWYSLFVAVLSPMVVMRFDLAPTALAFAAALWWGSGREGLGGTAAGLGALMKVFPGLVAVPAGVGEWTRPGRARGRGMLAFAATVAAGAAAWIGWGGPRVAETFQYHRDRGLEINSMYAGILYVAGRVSGAEVGRQQRYGCEELITPWSAKVAAVAPALQGAALLLVAWRARRAGGADGVRYAGGALLAFIAFGKVLSPQYLIWLAPFVAALDGRAGAGARGLFLAACAATSATFPWGFLALLRLEPWAFALLNVRNLLLLALLGLLLSGSGTAPDPGRARGARL